MKLCSSKKFNIINDKIYYYSDKDIDEKTVEIKIPQVKYNKNHLFNDDSDVLDLD